MSQFAALSYVIPLGVRADCILIERHGWFVLVVCCVVENGAQS